jgi:hypothetical protein
MRRSRHRLRDYLGFSRPKPGPGWGIVKSYFLSVLAGASRLPALSSLASPKGEDGAIEGFAVPLNPQAAKDSIHEPMIRGAYGLASPNQKTVLRLTVVPREEAGFDPEMIATAPEARLLPLEVVRRIRASWHLMQFTFESFDPEVYPALDFLLEIVSRTADLTEGVAADPISQVYKLPHEVIMPRLTEARISAPDHVAVRMRIQPDGRHIFTLGMQKFGLPELEITSASEADQLPAERLLMSLVQTRLAGIAFKPGDALGAPALFVAAEGGLDAQFWQRKPVLEILPIRGPMSRALADWAQSLSA